MVDEAASRLAGRQDGAVSIEEIHALGLGDRQIETRVARGSLHRMYQGVYAVGHMALTRRSYERAAVMACSPRAARSYQTAGAAWGVIRWSGPVHVTSRRARRPQDGFVLHRTRRLSRQDVVILEAIPVTSIHRTLVDLADVLTEKGWPTQSTNPR